jgi:putative nucleotidyltransferase with HDIG domain
MINNLRSVNLSYLFKYNGVLPFDVYLERHPGKFTRIHSRNEVYDSELLKHYEVKADGDLLIDESQLQDFNLFLTDVLQHSLVSPDLLTQTEVVEIIALGLELTYQSMLNQNDDLTINIDNAQLHVRSSIRLITEDLRAGVEVYLSIADNATLLKHSYHVMLLTLALAKKAGFTSEKALAPIGLGALLHDIGHSRIDEELFRKARLTPKEWDVVKDHPHLGLKIVDLYKGLSQEVRSIILQHHEYCNGRGYPNRLTQSQIYPPARLVAVADVFSSFIVKSHYRPVCYTPEEAIEVMRADIGHFDPVYLDTLEQVLGLSKKRSVV